MLDTKLYLYLGSMGGAAVRVLASHHYGCGPSIIQYVSRACWFSPVLQRLIFSEYSGFPPTTIIYPNSNSIVLGQICCSIYNNAVLLKW